MSGRRPVCSSTLLVFPPVRPGARAAGHRDATDARCIGSAITPGPGWLSGSVSQPLQDATFLSVLGDDAKEHSADTCNLLHIRTLPRGTPRDRCSMLEACTAKIVSIFFFLFSESAYRQYPLPWLYVDLNLVFGGCSSGRNLQYGCVHWPSRTDGH